MCLLVGQFCQCFKSHVINVDPMSTTTNSNTTLSEYINYSTYMLWLFYSPQILYSLQKIIMKHGDKLQFVKHIFFLDSIKHNTFYCALYFYRTTTWQLSQISKFQKYVILKVRSHFPLNVVFLENY
jgi:hypothetical protein